MITASIALSGRNFFDLVYAYFFVKAFRLDVLLSLLLRYLVQGMIHPGLIVVIFVVVFAGIPSKPGAAEFDDAQTAAHDGRYNDVVDILTRRIEAGGLDDEALVIAYSNRGIAYSLIQAYGRAQQDLGTAIKMDPDHVLTLNHLGVLSEHVDKNAAQAAQWYQQAAEQGFAAAQTNLGDLYLQQKVAAQSSGENYKLAMKWYEKAAAQDYVLAQIGLGVMYRDGLGVAKDTGKSVELFKKGAEAGAARGHYYLAIAYEKGRGVAQNMILAVAHYREAAERGDGEAQNSLGYMYRRGTGVSRDYAEAVKWYRLAAEQRVTDAMNRLAWILATCPDQRYCDGELALTLAKEAVELNSSPGYLDTLAAAYARNGDYAIAMEVVQDLLSRMSKGSARYNRYQGRLKRYQADHPYQL